MNGDGKDEFAIGYNLISHDGKVIWSLDKQLQDHADAVAILKLNPTDKEPTLFYAASDEGASGPICAATSSSTCIWAMSKAHPSPTTAMTCPGWKPSQ